MEQETSGATPRIPDSISSFWREGRPSERVAYGVGALLLSSGLIHLVILAVAGGSWEGPLSLRKAVTFGLSFGLTLITVAGVSSFLRLGDRARTMLLGAFTAACALETILVSIQAWRGVPSHYNMETAVDALVARTLAVGGVALVVIIVTFTFAAFRSNRAVPVSLRVAIQTGFVTLLAAQIVGALMIAKGMLLVIAGNPQAAYATGGSLKPTHGVTMHAILVLPALAWVVSFADWSERRRLNLVLLAAAGYVVLASAVAIGNVIGAPPQQTSTTVVMLFALGALTVSWAALFAINGAARSARTLHSGARATGSPR